MVPSNFILGCPHERIERSAIKNDSIHMNKKQLIIGLIVLLLSALVGLYLHGKSNSAPVATIGINPRPLGPVSDKPNVEYSDGTCTVREFHIAFPCKTPVRTEWNSERGELLLLYSEGTESNPSFDSLAVYQSYVGDGDIAELRSHNARKGIPSSGMRDIPDTVQTLHDEFEYSVTHSDPSGSEWVRITIGGVPGYGMISPESGDIYDMFVLQNGFLTGFQSLHWSTPTPEQVARGVNFLE